MSMESFVKKQLIIIVCFILLTACSTGTPALSAGESQLTIEASVAMTVIAIPTQTQLPPAPQEPSGSSQSIVSESSFLKTYNNTNDSSCPNIEIRKSGSAYIEKITCSDGSNETKTLRLEIVNGEERLVENPGNSYGDYMVIRADGTLAFYDDQGIIYEIPQN